jgi:hypothetical protein
MVDPAPGARGRFSAQEQEDEQEARRAEMATQT